MTDLETKLAELRIYVSQSGDDRITVYTTSEPLFCFERDSEAEAFRAVRETLQSYCETFFDVRNVRVDINPAPRREHLPRISLKPLKEYLPILQGGVMTPEHA